MIAPVPLSWAESTDERRNSRFEALSHLSADNKSGIFSDYWRVFPSLEANEVRWRVAFDSDAQPPAGVVPLLDADPFISADDAKAACQHVEVQLGGAAHAPRVPVEDPDQSAPLVTDDHGFAPTRTVVSRWSRNEGVLYLYRVWAKPENPEEKLEKRLEGDEYEAALPAYIRQQMVQSLVASITGPGGWVIPLVWTTQALGQVRMECEVHFVAVRGLHWAKNLRFGMQASRADFVEIPAPSHQMICSIVGEELSRKKVEYDRTLATTSMEQLQREIVKKARALGIDSPLPEPEQETGHVLPATLEHLSAAGLDLRGDALKR